MDRNTVIGMVLLGALLFIYLFTSTRNSHELEAQKKRYDDSVARVVRLQEQKRLAADSLTHAHAGAPAVAADTTGFNPAINGSEKLTTIENDLLRIVFTNKGGQPKEVVLKQFKSDDSNQVRLIDPAAGNAFSYAINTSRNQSSQIGELYFADPRVEKQSDGSQTVIFRLPAPAGESLEHRFMLRPGSYLVDWDVVVTNATTLFTQNNLNLTWHRTMMKTQRDGRYERQYSNVCFSSGESFDYIATHNEKQFDKPVEWVSMAQQFFNTTLIPKTPFSNGGLTWARETVDSSDRIGTADLAVQEKITGDVATVPFQWYFGPNEYKILEKTAPRMDKIVNLGRDFYSFVRPINVWIIMPVFNFFRTFVSNYGLAILLLTLFIRLLTSPLVYSSYLSGAKMKALRPELDEMRKRVGDDKQQQGVEQMKLFREAGVSVTGGCVPALLQIPIFFALFSFFNSNIALRGQSFLWAKDLSIYDSVLHLPFTIPGYGDHVSLFALLAVVTSFLISLYGMSMTPDQNNPAMKYMPYIMPVMLLLFFNRLPAALTWYYTVSNVITLGLQFVIQNYIIDHDKILAKLQENRRKPKSKPKWQERFEQMQEAQKKLQQAGNRSQKKP